MTKAVSSKSRVAAVVAGTMGIFMTLSACGMSVVPVASDAAGQTGSPTSAPTGSNHRPGAELASSGADCSAAGGGDCAVGAGPLDLANSASEAPQSDIDAQSAYTYTVEEYLSFVVKDLDETWTPWFLDNGFTEPMTGYELVEPTDTDGYQSRCRNTPIVYADTPNAYYCSADSLAVGGTTYQGMIILPVTTFQQFWSGTVFNRQSTVAGDFAVAIMVAHEFGHSVQDEILTQYNATHPDLISAPTGENIELIADCFAGAWTTSAYYRGMLENGDFEEAVAALRSMPDSDSHGSTEARVQAMLVGYNGTGTYQPGDPWGCVQTYWK